MFSSYNYAPTLSIRPSEIEALGRLPDFDKDALLPSIRLRKWRNSKNLERSFELLNDALGQRPIILDLDQRPSEVKSGCDAELIQLHSPTGGHSAWVSVFQSRPNLIPTLQWGGSPQESVSQAQNLIALNRGIAVRLRRNSQWDWATFNALANVNFGQSPVMLILEFGQVTGQTDITAAAAELAGRAEAAAALLSGANVTVSIAASSFPSEFASIDRAHARLPIRERGLFTLTSAATTFSNGGLPIVYGDFASVCCAKGTMARGGAPRIDLASRNEWAYYRREEDQSYVEAAKAIMADSAWQADLNIWGTNEIRRAATGDLTNLHYPQRWVATRINTHLHQQIHYGSPSAAMSTDEPYFD